MVGHGARTGNVTAVMPGSALRPVTCSALPGVQYGRLRLRRRRDTEWGRNRRKPVLRGGRVTPTITGGIRRLLRRRWRSHASLRFRADARPRLLVENAEHDADRLDLFFEPFDGLFFLAKYLLKVLHLLFLCREKCPAQPAERCPVAVLCCSPAEPTITL